MSESPDRSEPVRHEPARVEAEHQSSLQTLIDRVAGAHRDQPVPQIKEALDAELRRQGHPPQPDGWLDAVAREAAAGRRYIMGTAVEPPDARTTTPPTEEQVGKERQQEQEARRDT